MEFNPTPGRGTHSLPEVLSRDDQTRYREIFRLQSTGQWKLADKHIIAVKDKLLLGHVLFQRYIHSDSYKPSYQELREWLVQYRDHPGASRVFDIASKRKPKKAAEPPAPVSPLAAMVKMPAPPAGESLNEKAAALNGKVTELIEKGQLPAAEQMLGARSTIELLPTPTLERLTSDLATAYYGQGDDAKAYELASTVAERSGEAVPQSHWTAGLAAYRLGLLENAAFHFSQHALSPAAGSWNAAGGAYWAARVFLQIRQPSRVERWLRVAAEHHRTFYGQIARRALGLESPLDWSPPALEKEHIERVVALPGGRRAVALIEIGELALAEEELRAHVWKLDEPHARSLLAVADAVALPNTAVRAGTRLAQFGSDAGDRVLYPEPPWIPRNGFKLDRALLFAFMRQESVFYSRATSSAGAIGLMQLMPDTAQQMASEADLRIKGQLALYDPGTNISLGQQYITWLLARPDINGNLFKVAIAYNAGIGNLRKWDKAVAHQGDPLLFIESIPSRETRNFVERVLANFWIYRERMGQGNPSLDAVAAGEWPRYVPFDNSELVIAEDVRH